MSNIHSTAEASTEDTVTMVYMTAEEYSKMLALISEDRKEQAIAEGNVPMINSFELPRGYSNLAVTYDHPDFY